MPNNRGIFYAASAYLLWGFLPIYWKALQAAPALEILAHRMAWSLLFVVGVMLVRRQWGWLKPALRQPRTLLTFTLSGAVLAVNWLTYIWGVNAGFVVETSLGYFINPLVSVVLGVLFLRERLRAGQWTAVSLAAIGVIYLTLSYGRLPWIALTLAFSFGTYGLLRKTAALNSLEGLTLETAVLFPFALGYLLFLEWQGTAAFLHAGPGISLLLALAGVVTAVPLLLFAAGARRIPLSTVGLLQYIAPTLQFLIGVLVYHEPFTSQRLVGFSIIWAALLLYSGEGFWNGRRRRQTAPTL